MPSLTIADVFAHNRRHFATAPALSVDGVVVATEALGRRVDEIARVLGRHVGAGERLAIWLPNGVDWFATFVAASRLGTVVVPVNTRLTGAELRMIVADAGARLLLTTTAYRGRRLHAEAVAAFGEEAAGPLILCADDGADPADWTVWSERPAYDPVSVPPDLLCIQYTSGTTARPKGVMLTNDAYLRTASYVAAAQMLTPATQFISGSPFFHCSGSMHGIAVCLMAGSTLHTMSRWDPEHAALLTERFGCTASHNIFFRDVLALDVGRMRQKFAAMHCAVATGTPDMLMRVHDELGIAGISNVYGMTETAGNFTMCFPDDALAARVTANGRPMPGNHIRIVAPADGTPCAPGAEGEIEMFGPTVAHGYFRAPAETTQGAFTADGWLRSGDLGRIAPNGDLVYVARLKDVIRSGGENLSPGEIEEVLRQVAGIREACVLPAPDARLDEVPIAVVTLQAGAAPDWAGVAAALRTRLAGYKMPRRIYVAAELPMTATNKVQRAQVKALLDSGGMSQVV